jgi:hypothetical protein
LTSTRRIWYSRARVKHHEGRIQEGRECQIRFNQAVSTVKKSQASVVAAC